MNQLRRTPEVQSLGDREKGANLTKFHFLILFALLITGNKTNNVTHYGQKPPIKCVSRWQSNWHGKGERYEIRFLAEANLTPRHLARFSHASRQRVSGAPLSCDAAPRFRSGLRTTIAFPG